MKTLSFVILFVTISAFATPTNSGAIKPKVGSWPKAIAQTVHDKTIKDLCESNALCSKFSKTELLDSAVFKLSSSNESTILISYKSAIVALEHTARTAQFKVNHKILDLKHIETMSTLSEQILIKLPGNQQTTYGFSWFTFANAQMIAPSQHQISIAIVKLILATEQNEICQQTLEIANKCDQLTKETTAALQAGLTQGNEGAALSVSTRESAIRETEVLKPLYEVSSQMEMLNSQFSTIQPSKKEAIERCECREGVCKLAEKTDKPTALGQSFKACVQTAKTIQAQFPTSKSLATRIQKLEDFLTEEPVPVKAAELTSEKGFTKNSNDR